MRWDGEALPDPMEVQVLRSLELIRTDALPSIAARWLASDVIDSDAVRDLAGHQPNDIWGLAALLDEVITDYAAPVAADAESQERLAVEWVAQTWRTNGDTRAAIATLARLGAAHPEFDFGPFIGLDDEWTGNWGRLPADLERASVDELLLVLRGLWRSS